MTPCLCQFCQRKLEPVQEFRFLVETQMLGDPGCLERFRQLPADRNGKPLQVCQGCQRLIKNPLCQVRIETEGEQDHRQIRTVLIATLGVLSLGWFVATVLGTPRS